MKRTFTQILSLVLVFFAMQTAQAQLQNYLDVNAPDNIGTTYSDVGEAAAPDWPGALELGETVTGDLVYVSANVDPDDDVIDDIPVMGCVELDNADEVMGNIALVQRGACTFSAKVKAAEDAGAIAVVICNNRPVSEDGGGVVNMAASPIDGYTNAIPVVFLSQEDCAPIRMEMDAGTTVNVTLGVQAFVGLAAGYNYITPQKNIVPMWGIGSTIYAAEETEALITAVITDPNGVETTLTAAGTTTPDGAFISVDEPYLPEAVGTYNVVATNNLNDEILEQDFMIIDGDYFQTGYDEISGGVSPGSGDPFAEDGFTYNIHMVLRTGDVDIKLETVEFGLENWTEILTDAQTGIDFTVEVYDVSDPAANDGTVGFPAEADVNLEYSELYGDFVGLTQYSASGDEQDGDLVIADFDFEGNPFGGAPTLEAGKAYLVAVRYDGSNVGNAIAPSYARSGTLALPVGLDGSIFTGRFFTGFIGNPSIHIKSTAPLASSNTEEVILDADAISVSPNPASDELNVNVSLENVSSEVRIQVADMTGRIVLDQTTENVQAATLSYNVSTWATGTYLINVITEEGSRLEKFVKK